MPNRFSCIRICILTVYTAFPRLSPLGTIVKKRPCSSVSRTRIIPTRTRNGHNGRDGKPSVQGANVVVDVTSSTRSGRGPTNSTSDSCRYKFAREAFLVNGITSRRGRCTYAPIPSGRCGFSCRTSGNDGICGFSIFRSCSWMD